ncbi:MAG: murein biosynthesis integral membrane protein MurJ [Candidatus Dormibacter sp.]
MSMERRRIASAATLILVAYGLSRILGAVRELVIANTFGTKQVLDDYRVAFGVPDLLFNLLLAGAISSAFIPVLSEFLAHDDRQRAREIATRVLNSGLLILTAGAAILFLVAPFYVSLIAFGYSHQDHELIVSLTRILLLQPIFLGAGGLVIGILTAHQRFLAQALAPLFYNGAIIVAAAAFAPHVGVTALAVGVVVGAMLHVGVQLPALWQTGWRPMPAFGWNDPGVRKVGRLMFPIALGLAAAQVNVFVDTILGTSLPHGRVAALRYADTTAQLPLGTFSQALAFVLFPFLARDAAIGAFESIRHRTALALRLNLFVLVPASVGLALLSTPIIVVLFERGPFGAESVAQTSYALVFFSLGLAAQAATALLVRVFYALQDVMTPLKISLTVIVVNLGTNVILVHLLAQGGLALGTSIAATLNAILLGVALRRRLGGIEGGQILATARRALIGVVPMALVVYLTALLLLGGSLHNGIRPVVALLTAVLLGAITYVGVERLLRSEELAVVMSVIRRDRSRV